VVRPGRRRSRRPVPRQRGTALERISQNAEQYQVALLDLHRAPIRPFQYSIWYRVLPDESIVVAALSDRRDLSLARRRALPPIELT